MSLPSNNCGITEGSAAEVTDFVPGNGNLSTILVLRGGPARVEAADMLTMPADLSRRFKGVGNVSWHNSLVVYFGSHTVFDGDSLCRLAAFFDANHEARWELVRI
jgi:hypothetical protein